PHPIIGPHPTSQDVTRRWHRNTPFLTIWCCSRSKGVDQDTVISCVDDLLHRGLEPPDLSRAEFTLDDAALHMVQVLPAYPQDLRVPLRCGVIDHDGVHPATTRSGMVCTAPLPDIAV